MLKRLTVLICTSALAIFAWLGCSRTKTEVVPAATRAFYFWRTTFALNAAEREVMLQQHVNRLYVRLFDVSLDRQTLQATPVGRSTFKEAPPVGVEVVPVVFLTNSVFEQKADPAALAKQVWELARSMAEDVPFEFHEIQIDCDWSDHTREAYFAFCRSLRALAAEKTVKLSATIRLHQVKYSARTGVPPVDRGMLMFYNMGHLEPSPTRSSIFNAEDASRYASFIDAYSLPLDGALPVFSWTIHSRGDKVIGLLDKTGDDELTDTPGLKRVANQRYVASEAALFHGSYLQEGDALAVESMTPAAAREAASLLARHFHPHKEFAIALFDLDERNLKAYGPQDLEALFTAVR